VMRAAVRPARAASHSPATTPCTWAARSRVGTTTRAPRRGGRRAEGAAPALPGCLLGPSPGGPRSPPGNLATSARSAWTRGSAYARVLPDPVGAHTARSCEPPRPPAVAAQVAAWTGKSVVKPAVKGREREMRAEQREENECRGRVSPSSHLLATTPPPAHPALARPLKGWPRPRWGRAPASRAGRVGGAVFVVAPTAARRRPHAVPPRRQTRHAHRRRPGRRRVGGWAPPPRPPWLPQKRTRATRG